MTDLETLNKEIRKHRAKLQEEKNRHEDKLIEIREDAGLDDIQQLMDETQKVYSDCQDLRSEIRTLFYRGINEMVMADRETEELSIRDGSIYHKNSQNEVNLGFLLSSCQDELMGCMREENEESVRKLLRLMERMELPDGYLGKGRQHYKAWYKRDEPYKGYDTAIVDTREGLPTIGLADAARIGSIERLDDGFPDGAKRLRITALDGEQMRFLIAFKSQIEQTYQDLKTLLENERERRDDVRAEVEKEVAKYIMLSGITD